MSALAANANNLTTLKNFIPLEKIGTGSFSSVYKVRRVDDDKIYALKKVYHESNLGQNYVSQITIKTECTQLNTNISLSEFRKPCLLQGGLL